MDPITTAIVSAVSALAAGASKGITEASKAAMTEAYQKLKDLLTHKFGTQSKVVTAVADLEKEYDSKGRQLTLQEQIAKCRADQDQELVQMAQELLNQVQKQQGSEKHIQGISGNYNAQNIGSGSATVNVNHPKEP